MNKIVQLLKELESTTSTNDKVSLLSKYPDFESLSVYLKYSLDPLRNYYVRKIPDYSYCGERKMLFMDAANFIVSNLSTRKVTGHAALNLLTNTLSSVPPEEANLLERMVLKDLRCGVNIGLVNKAFKGLIKEYPCLLATPYDEKVAKHVTFPAIVQTKEDGGRINAVVNLKTNTVDYYTRNGNSVTILNENIHESFLRLGDMIDLYDIIVFDGELLAVTPQGNLADRQTCNGLFTKAIRGTISMQESMRQRIVLWDYVDYDTFNGNTSPTAPEFYYDKMNILSRNLAELSTDILKMVDTHIVNDMESVEKILHDHYDRGLEGVILKDRELIWEDKRSKKQLKFKAEKDCDLEVIGWNEGEGKYSGMLGSLQCKSRDGKVVVNISGWTDDQRKEITPDNSKGRIIKVLYNTKIKDKKSDVYSLFLPRFLEFREDKDVADSFEEIK